MGDATTKPEDRTVEDWSRAFTVRSNRLVRLLELNAPPIIISDEIDLIVQSLEALETKRGDRDSARRVRELNQIEHAREIEAAGGQEAWEAKIREELDAEDALTDLEETGATLQ
jgi:hypothetical protein